MNTHNDDGLNARKRWKKRQRVAGRCMDCGAARDGARVHCPRCRETRRRARYTARVRRLAASGADADRLAALVL